jgi:hypothetical protein
LVVVAGGGGVVRVGIELRGFEFSGEVTPEGEVG